MPREALALIKPIGDLRIDYLPRTGLALLRLFIVLRLLRRSSLLGDLIVGARTRTTDANRALEALAARAREDPAAARDGQQAGRRKAVAPFLNSRRSSRHTSPNTATARPSPRSWSRRPPKARRRRPYSA